MADLDVKVLPPKWDSNKRAEWPTFATDFESFVEYCNGEKLVALVHLAANPNSQDVLPSNTSTSGESAAPPEADEVLTPGSFETRFNSMDGDLKKLDFKLY